MPVVRAAVLLSFAVSAASANLAEDLGLLQGLHKSLDGLASQSFNRESLIKTSDKLKQMVVRTQGTGTIPDQGVRDVLEEYKTALQQFRSHLEAEVEAENQQLESHYQREIHECDLQRVDASLVDGPASDLDATYETWKDAKEATESKAAALETLLDGLEAPCVPDDHVLDVRFFTELENWVESNRPAVSRARGEADEAASALEAAVEPAREAQRTYAGFVCELKRNSMNFCKEYGECRHRTQEAYNAHTQVISALGESYRSEAEVIAKSLCFVDLMLNMQENEVIPNTDIDRCSNMAVDIDEGFALRDVSAGTTEMQDCVDYRESKDKEECPHTADGFDWADACAQCNVSLNSDKVSIDAEGRITFTATESSASS